MIFRRQLIMYRPARTSHADMARRREIAAQRLFYHTYFHFAGDFASPLISSPCIAAAEVTLRRYAARFPRGRGQVFHILKYCHLLSISAKAIIFAGAILFTNGGITPWHRSISCIHESRPARSFISTARIETCRRSGRFCQ